MTNLVGHSTGSVDARPTLLMTWHHEEKEEELPGEMGSSSASVTTEPRRARSLSMRRRLQLMLPALKCSHVSRRWVKDNQLRHRAILQLCAGACVVLFQIKIDSSVRKSPNVV